MKSVKLYLKDAQTGEIAVRFVCHRCGREMEDHPPNWLCKTAKNSAVMDLFTFRCWCSKTCKQLDPDKYKW